MTARYYCGDAQLLPGESVRLSAEESRHLVKVMRARVGDKVIVFGGGSQLSATVAAVEENGIAILKLGDPVGAVNAARIQMSFLIPWIKGGKTDLVVQKLTELGVSQIIVFQAQREVARGDGSKIDRLQRIALESCKQCERADVPHIAVAGSLSAAVDICDIIPVSSRFLLHERHDNELFSEIVKPVLAEGDALMFASGPEGGWHPDEVATVSGKIRLVSLGARILRAETAPIVAAASALTLAGEI